MIGEEPTVKIFYSYAREDQVLRDELEKHLGILKRQGYITSWSNQNISAGDDWKQTTNTNLENADIILLLVSPDFIHSDYCYSSELQKALEIRETGKAEVVPIILRPTDWENSLFCHLQALPTNAKPITTWPNKDEAFLDTIKGIGKVVKSRLAKRYLESAKKLCEEPSHYEEALIICNKITEMNNDDDEAHSLKVWLLLELKQYEKALLVNQKALELKPQQSQLYSIRGTILFHLGRYEEALTAHQQAANFEARAEYLRDQGETFLVLQQYNEALRAYSRAIELDSNIHSYHAKRGDICSILELYKEANESYERAISLHPDASYYNNNGDILVKLEHYQDALANYQKALSIHPQEAGVYNSIGHSLFMMKKYEESIAFYQMASEIDKSGIVYQHNRLMASALSCIKQYWECSNKFENVNKGLLPPEWESENTFSLLAESMENEQNIKTFKMAVVFRGKIEKLSRIPLLGQRMKYSVKGDINYYPWAILRFRVPLKEIRYPIPLQSYITLYELKTLKNTLYIIHIRRLDLYIRYRSLGYKIHWPPSVD